MIEERYYLIQYMKCHDSLSYANLALMIGLNLINCYSLLFMQQHKQEKRPPYVFRALSHRSAAQKSERDRNHQREQDHRLKMAEVENHSGHFLTSVLSETR